MHLDTFGIVVEWKADLADRGLLLVLGCIDNKVFEKWVFIYFIRLLFIDDEVDIRLDFSDFINVIVNVNCAGAFADPHFPEFFFGVAPEVEVFKLHCLPWVIRFEPKLGVVVADTRRIFIFGLMLLFSLRSITL